MNTKALGYLHPKEPMISTVEEAFAKHPKPHPLAQFSYDYWIGEYASNGSPIIETLIDGVTCLYYHDKNMWLYVPRVR